MSARLRDPGGDHRARLAVGRRREGFGRHRRHVDTQVDAVEQRPADAALVTRDRVGRAAAGQAWMAELAARTRVHRGDQLEARREIGAPRRARDRDAAGLERLAQRFEAGSLPLGQLVQEQHAVVRERDLARPRR